MDLNGTINGSNSFDLYRILMDLNGIETDWNYIGIQPSTIGISYAAASKNMGLNHQLFGDKTDT